MTEPAPLMSFGRYRGHSIRWVADSDPHYALWLLSQPWLKRKYLQTRSALVRRVAKNLLAEMADEEAYIARQSLPLEERFKLVQAAEFAARKL